MGENSMNIVTIKAKARLAAMKIWKGKNFAVDAMSIVIEQVFTPNAGIEPLYSMCTFSGVTGIGIYNKQNRCVAVIPPQLPIELNFTEKSMRESAIDHIKLQTERVARIILDKLNEA